MQIILQQHAAHPVFRFPAARLQLACISLWDQLGYTMTISIFDYSCLFRETH